jgi:ZIP family zinc transporter
MGMIDILIPDFENPHHYKNPDNKDIQKNNNLMRLGLFSALAIVIHNFPEGIVTFGSALTNIKLGFIIAFAIAIHNIPEGIAVSVPIYFATKNKKKAFYYSFLSGFSEPLGAAIGFIFLMQFLNLWTLSFLLALSAGIMVYISVDELLPTAHRYGHGHCVIMGFIIGIFIMAVSILIL